MTEESKVSLYGGPEKQNSSKLFPLLFSCDGDKKTGYLFFICQTGGKNIWADFLFFIFLCVFAIK